MRQTAITRPRYSSFYYQALYRLRLAFWNSFETDAGLIELIEGPSALPPGKALDLGCGNGRNAAYLARHGWQVTGIDSNEPAVAQARKRGSSAGGAVRIVHGDVTELESLGLGSDCSLYIDYGCYHSLAQDVRIGYARAVTAVAAPGAILWMWGREARGRGGMSKAELEERFPQWNIVSAVRAPDEIRLEPGRASLVQRYVAKKMASPDMPPGWRYLLTRRG
ncbi:class I SAM-dependent methyltransferase [Nocardia sp. NPDC048505]|uniref:class I SAM-dependent methyltransferase n=1 Tax=Nocardia sp. NPDC048505 TaxID=3155756 RepID=UPI0033EDF31F